MPLQTQPLMQQQDQIQRRIESDRVIIGLRKDGIIHVYYKAGTEVNVELQLKLVDVFNEICGGVKRGFIYEAGEDVTVTAEARDNAIRLEDEVPQKASVVVVNNLAHKMIAQFYYQFNKPKTPYKVVSDFQAGIDWLLQLEEQ